MSNPNSTKGVEFLNDMKGLVNTTSLEDFKQGVMETLCSCILKHNSYHTNMKFINDIKELYRVVRDDESKIVDTIEDLDINRDTLNLIVSNTRLSLEKKFEAKSTYVLTFLLKHFQKETKSFLEANYSDEDIDAIYKKANIKR